MLLLVLLCGHCRIGREIIGLELLGGSMLERLQIGELLQAAALLRT